MDLTRFLLEDAETCGFLRLKNARVLELGCGHGLPGLACAMRGAKEVVFADYNPDVLRALTVPNARANGFATGRDTKTETENSDASSDASFRASPGPRQRLGLFAQSGNNLLQPGAFDVVLAAGTVYEPSSFTKLARSRERAARKVRKKCRRFVVMTSAAFAAKSYYFGVGGGAGRSARA